MKQMIPFLVIGVIVAGAMFLLRDEYEEPFQPDLSDEVTQNDWNAIFFINDIENDVAEVGLRLTFINEDLEPDEIDALEFFVEFDDTELNGFFYQDLEVEQFDGTVKHGEECQECSENLGEKIVASAVVNWRANGETKTEQFHFGLVTD
ncbi:hypothetical protein CR194_16530 [Salipaludibacillus keqinensis]|uniref:Uncharacterized protein n=1 Tax=Salipaludibacillus keqinensis TaxID=2045207 RepID=A0A323TIF5_9BACI|nr:hypothetical protein [Salipaludibacillus keqinensis]PYZ92433.1 hypothetical protein CR194_16530 [Salipaludibacillus keqinensis]